MHSAKLGYMHISDARFLSLIHVTNAPAYSGLKNTLHGLWHSGCGLDSQMRANIIFLAQTASNTHGIDLGRALTPDIHRNRSSMGAGTLLFGVVSLERVPGASTALMASSLVPDILRFWRRHFLEHLKIIISTFLASYSSMTTTQSILQRLPSLGSPHVQSPFCHGHPLALTLT